MLSIYYCIFLGFDNDAGKFFIFSLTLIQVTVCGCSFAFLFSATFGIFAVANLMAAVLYTIMLVSSGSWNAVNFDKGILVDY